MDTDARRSTPNAFTAGVFTVACLWAFTEFPLKVNLNNLCHNDGSSSEFTDAVCLLRDELRKAVDQVFESQHFVLGTWGRTDRRPAELRCRSDQKS